MRNSIRPLTPPMARRIKLRLLPTIALALTVTLFCQPLFLSALKADTSKTTRTLTNPKVWQATENQKNPLVGKIWSAKKSGFIEPIELAKELSSKPFVLLGEIHDNPDHHTLQAKIINWLSAQTTNKPTLVPALVIEMIKLNQMQRLNAYRKGKNASAEHLGSALQWNRQGWPDWKIYQPIGEQIFKHNLEVFPGHTSRTMINHLIKSDMSILPEEALKTFQLDKPLGNKLNKALEQDIRIGHCNKLPEHVIAPMTNVQRFRDAWMADVMIQAREIETSGEKRQVILIAGNGHTRTDRGAPWYLRQRLGPNVSLTVEFVEASTDQAKTIKDLASQTPNGQIAADFIWVTPATSRQDPCNNIPDFGKK